MLTCGLLAFLPYCSSPEAEGVASRQVAEWITASERELDALHGFFLLRHGKAIADNAGVDFVCVLSGETTRADLENYRGLPPAIVVETFDKVEVQQG